MQKKAKTFFLLLMAAFLIGVLIHLIVPLQIVVNGTQKIEEAYNGYKIQVQQNTVRSIAYLNSLSISNSIQMYQNVRSFFIRIFDIGNRYEEIDQSKVFLNNAYQLANKNASELEHVEFQKSMWYLKGISDMQHMNQLQQLMYMLYTQIQNYLDSIQTDNQFNQGLQAIEITINYLGQEMYFQYPSTVDQRFKSLDNPVLSHQYHNTILNYKTDQRYQTIFDNVLYLRACSPILDGTQPFAVVCLKLNVQDVTKKITSTLKVPNFQLSSSRYYLVRPLYPFQKLQKPQIISYFNSDDLTNIIVPKDQYFQQNIEDLYQLFTAKQNYFLNVQQHQKTKTYYITPIQTYNNLDSKQIIMFLIVVNDFSESNLRSASHYKQIFVVMIVPSSILLIIAALTMGFIMRPLFRKLNHYVRLMNEYCHYIKKNDMNLEIETIGQTSDFIQIFKKLYYLNLLNKLSTPSYLKISDNQRVIKLLRALQLFDVLGYSKLNIYLNLGQCYSRLKQYQNALKFMKLSIDSTIYELGGIPAIQVIIKQQGDAKIQRRKYENNKKQRPSIRHLRYKLFRLCQLLYMMFKPGDSYISQQLTKNVQILKKLHYRSNISTQYIYSYILEAICYLDTKYEKNNNNRQEIMQIQSIIEQKLDTSNQMIRKLQSTSQKTRIIPLQILKSYRYYLKGKYLRKKSQYYQAFQSFILALNGKCFDPHIHSKIKSQIFWILQFLQLDNERQMIHNTFDYIKQQEQVEYEQDKLNLPKQFIFITDVSNPRMSMKQFNQWKIMARKMAEYILDHYVKPRDRIGINQFCNQLKVICNLIQKGTSQSMLKKQLMSSIKARDQTIYSHLIPNLRRAIQRTKTLRRQKIFIIFLKQGYATNSIQILEQIKNSTNSTFVFLTQEMSQRISDAQEGFYIVDFKSYDDIDMILGNKSIKRADNILYLL